MKTCPKCGSNLQLRYEDGWLWIHCVSTPIIHPTGVCSWGAKPVELTGEQEASFERFIKFVVFRDGWPDIKLPRGQGVSVHLASEGILSPGIIPTQVSVPPPMTGRGVVVHDDWDARTELSKKEKS
jgi:hypothetical protein